MKLSIIIPVYNTQDTLDRCIQSVLLQSFIDYEIILVDDGSPDNCPIMCDNYARMDKRIKVIHKVNGGLSDARNAGIDQARGEYITFIDSDDAIRANTLQPLMDELSQYPNVDILEYPALERYGHPHKQHLLSFTPHEYTSGIEYWFRERAYQHTYACNKIYKYELFRNVRFPKGKNFEDAMTMPYLLGLIPIEGNRTRPIIRVTDVGEYIYYWNENGITDNAKYEDLRNLYEGHCQTLRYILKETGEQPGLLKKYSDSLQDFMTRILNILLDLYELSGKYEDNPTLVNDVRRLSQIVAIKSFKLKLLNFVGYHTLCKLNKIIHKIHKNH